MRERSFASARRATSSLVRVFVVTAVVLGTIFVGGQSAFAATPTWPSGQYMGLLQNLPFTIPIAINGGAPLTAMTVATAPGSTTGFALANINLVAGTADMVGTWTGASGATATAAIRATNSSGSANSSFAFEGYNCSWSS